MTQQSPSEGASPPRIGRNDIDPTVSSPKVAYLVMTHQNIGLIESLVLELLRGDPEGVVIVDHDSTKGTDVEVLANDRVSVALTAGGRGDFGTIERLLAMIERALEYEPDYLIYLSGEDFPCRPLTEFKSELARSGDGWLHYFPALDATRSEWGMHQAAQRFNFRWYAGPRLSAAGSRKLHFLHGLNYLQPWLRFNVAYGRLRLGVRTRILPEGMTPFGGSAWWTLSREAAVHVVEVTKRRPELQDWGRHAIAIDEAYFHTTLMSSDEFTFDGNNRRYIDFSGTKYGHPRYLTLEDFGDIQKSRAYFTRKVTDPRLREALTRVVRQQHST